MCVKLAEADGCRACLVAGCEVYLGILRRALRAGYALCYAMERSVCTKNASKGVLPGLKLIEVELTGSSGLASHVQCSNGA